MNIAFPSLSLLDLLGRRERLCYVNPARHRNRIINNYLKKEDHDIKIIYIIKKNKLIYLVV